MKEQINKKILFIILIFISFVLVSAFVIEYGFNHQPCKLCLYERIPYFLSILLIAKIFLIRGYEKVTLLILSLIFIISSILAFYHFGIEQGFFKESLACAVENLSENLTKEDLLKELNQNSISCKDVSFSIFGISLAAINTIFSIALSVIFIKLFISYEKN
ncbi:disulfide bond formation protein B [Pelagibacteraceae bacterium]|nr:disulfide bond formation protein B [Pelagibacteraceae bacterium]